VNRLFARGDAVVVVDVLNDFDHEDGERLLRSFRERAEHMADVLSAARRAAVPVVYVNDERHRFRSDAPALVREALAARGGAMIWDCWRARKARVWSTPWTEK